MKQNKGKPAEKFFREVFAEKGSLSTDEAVRAQAGYRARFER